MHKIKLNKKESRAVEIGKASLLTLGYCNGNRNELGLRPHWCGH